MSLSSGTRLGAYEITAKLGAGGMGEVYRATDPKLKRDVAIKVLPADFTQDVDRLERFEREAQLLAQLHHPNIASVFGLEESNGTQALVLVSGQRGHWPPWKTSWTWFGRKPVCRPVVASPAGPGTRSAMTTPS
jgi:serine/threonine protein kinase